MAPDQVGPDEDTGVTALSNCGASMNTTVFVTVPASPFPVRVSRYYYYRSPKFCREPDNYEYYKCISTELLYH